MKSVSCLSFMLRHESDAHVEIAYCSATITQKLDMLFKSGARFCVVLCFCNMRGRGESSVFVHCCWSGFGCGSPSCPIMHCGKTGCAFGICAQRESSFLKTSHNLSTVFLTLTEGSKIHWWERTCLDASFKVQVSTWKVVKRTQSSATSGLQSSASPYLLGDQIKVKIQPRILHLLLKTEHTYSHQLCTDLTIWPSRNFCDWQKKNLLDEMTLNWESISTFLQFPRFNREHFHF